MTTPADSSRHRATIVGASGSSSAAPAATGSQRPTAPRGMRLSPTSLMRSVPPGSDWSARRRLRRYEKPPTRRGSHGTRRVTSGSVTALTASPHQTGSQYEGAPVEGNEGQPPPGPENLPARTGSTHYLV